MLRRRPFVATTFPRLTECHRTCLYLVGGANIIIPTPSTAASVADWGTGGLGAFIREVIRGSAKALEVAAFIQIRHASCGPGG